MFKKLSLAVLIFFLFTTTAQAVEISELIGRNAAGNESDALEEVLLHFEAPSSERFSNNDGLVSVELSERSKPSAILILNDTQNPVDLDISVPIPDDVYLDYVTNEYVVVQGGRLTGLTLEPNQLSVIYLTREDLEPGNNSGIWTVVILGGASILLTGIVGYNRKRYRDKHSIWGN